ncbi:class I SAM-dependent DNA methyltransferase [Parvularcula maris]|uniref:site-specific DNA-methyltransferase (adenine-specific) n=1 Tax=Parvularcula maris TaxID=2965077 RepID=A0A9X2LA81_9PROT|nr:SAM-dependent methyltransferase [Parvularcula maris]MCQ8184867.1 SAM-dependent methyltransferase [Parvularcula maris]
MDIEDFIERWKGSGGAERSNFQSFAAELCQLLGVPTPDPAKPENAHNDYVFERSLKDPVANSTKFVDLYKRGHFVMEGKQSAPGGKEDENQLRLFIASEGVKAGHAERNTRKWDRVMRAAFNQARGYVGILPEGHASPPFLLVVDVGHAIDVFADFSGRGRYDLFPDRKRYRIWLDDLRDEKVRDRLRTIWTDPYSLDPARESAEVTKDIAERLARIAKQLEARRNDDGTPRHEPQEIAEFLMRCLFCMFAEDVGLLPDHRFEKLLEESRERPLDKFPAAIEAFWRAMDIGGDIGFSGDKFRKFNGRLFKNAVAPKVSMDTIAELLAAAKRDWQAVEPAIFGTLLEQALDPRERKELGAHFTPRAYVERLVVPTIIEPLTEDWNAAQIEADLLERKGDHEGALDAIRSFHRQLCNTRVLDPACGTGNFLYVALELMKKLEGDVLNVLETYGGQRDLDLDDATVEPSQFFGLEINPRAVPIAELVLWLGYLKWQIANGGIDSITPPVLKAHGNIRQQDALLAYHDKTLQRDEHGRPITRWDGHTLKKHPVTGEDVPDPDARTEAYTYENPRRAEWPEAHFVVGNPPFIGGKDLRRELGDGYAEALWKARKDVPGGADLVMHFWDEAATRLLRKPSTAAKKKGETNPLRRFGFITTNSITQTFSRRVIERHMAAKDPLHLAFAVPDHPWLKATDKAAVRIAMTVAEPGTEEGTLAEVTSEKGLNTDTPLVELESEKGLVKANLTLGANLSEVVPLLANSLVVARGVQTVGTGFIIEAPMVRKFSESEQGVIVPFLNGSDLMQKSRNVLVIDTFNLSKDNIQERYQGIYSHLLEHVWPVRQTNNRPSYKDRWWLFGEPSLIYREGVAPLDRFIASSRTAKHRVFSFQSSRSVMESKVITVALDTAESLAVLSSRTHIVYANAAGGWQGAGNDPVYQHTETFDPFPFPNHPSPDRLAQLGERLDAFRKERLEDWDWLTMTRLYNALERYREAMAGHGDLTEEERDIHERAQVSILADLHDEIDREVLGAYGWSDLEGALVGKPGGTTPSQLKSKEQEEAEEELLTRLVALNKSRAEEEARGHVRWLRPDYQIEKLGHKVPGAEDKKKAAEEAVPAAVKPSWPKDPFEQIKQVRALLQAARKPVTTETLVVSFKPKLTKARTERLGDVLASLQENGLAYETENGFTAAR